MHRDEQREKKNRETKEFHTTCCGGGSSKNDKTWNKLLVRAHFLKEWKNAALN